MRLFQTPLSDKVSPFSLEYTLSCGQVFRWEKINNYWYGVVEGTVIILKQDFDRLFFETFPERRGIEFIRRYLRLDDDLTEIVSTIDKDRTIRRALKALYGLRITRQDPWECLVSYICATFSNILRIKGMILNLSRKFGSKISYDGKTFYTFPCVQALANAALSDLSDCGLGFRAKYVRETSGIIKDKKVNFDDLGRLTYREAKRQLITLPGVGHKVADCILLFSLEKLEAFPVDIWIKRIVSKYYKQNCSDSKLLREKGQPTDQYARIREFGRTYFGEYAGYAQEYLYHYYRLHNTQIRNTMQNMQLS